MVPLARRVIHAIHEFEAGEYEFALEQTAIAIDISAQRHFAQPKSSRKSYKEFLAEYYWLLELMCFNGIDVQKTTFGNYPIEKEPTPTIAQLIYHVVRCSLVHSGGLPATFGFNDRRQVQCAHGIVSLPCQLLWALLGIVVFCKVNGDEKSEGDYFLTIEDRKFLIRDSWGQESAIRPLFDQIVKVRVGLQFPTLKPLQGD